MPPAHPRVVVRDPDSKKRRILGAARLLLVERDFSDIALDDVAKKAGVAEGELSRYFKSKEELFSAAFDDLAGALGLELAALAKAGLTGKDLLIAAAKVVLNHFDHNRDFLGLAGAGRAPNCGDRTREKLRECDRETQSLIRGLLTAATKDEGRSIGDAEFAAAAFLGLCRSAAVLRLLHGREGAFERDAERVVGFFLEGGGASL